MLKNNDVFQIGSLQVKALSTPGHTTGSVSYYVVDPDSDEKAVFTGDTLFIAGSGRFFEGTGKDMYYSLIEQLGSLPRETKVYCGHEYTVSNLKFAASVEPNNIPLAEKLKWAHSKSITVPSTIEDEFRTNPFMRVYEASIQSALGVTDPIQAMDLLREMKNKF
jgi:hydroxyacylglutathione hydrolase